MICLGDRHNIWFEKNCIKDIHNFKCNARNEGKKNKGFSVICFRQNVSAIKMISIIGNIIKLHLNDYSMYKS